MKVSHKVQQFTESDIRGRQQVRFCFCKTDATIDEAARRMAKLKS